MTAKHCEKFEILSGNNSIDLRRFDYQIMSQLTDNQFI